MDPERLSQAEQDFAIRTWLYLRLAMVALVVGLGVAVVYEVIKVPGACTQNSISAYWYTPVQAYFVGALLGIGLSLICLKGNSEVEDVLLTLAGLLAPFVAFVPTPDPGNCASAYLTSSDPLRSVTNNVVALQIVEAAALTALVVIGWRARRDMSRTTVVAYVVAVAAPVALAVAFWVDRDYFVGHAHFPAAGAMFAAIILVVVLNGVRVPPNPRRVSLRNRYGAIAGAMVGSLVIIPIGLAADWDHWVIWLEGILIALFAAFWFIQTLELRHQGLSYTRRATG